MSLIAQADNTRITLPERQLAPGSLCISPNTPLAFSEWTEKEHLQAFYAIQKTAAVWSSQGIQDFLVLGRIEFTEKKPFCWEVVPYPSAGFWQQFKVAWRIFFGGVSYQDDARKLQMAFQECDISSDHKEESSNSVDPFCSEQIITKQKIQYESEVIHLLYNLKPIVTDHFLVVTKTHRSNFLTVNSNEYLEMIKTVSRLFKEFSQTQQAQTMYIYHKTGKRAGQTVPHWHTHVVVTTNKTQEFFGKIKTLIRMIFPFWGISNRRMEEMTHAYSEWLKGTQTHPSLRELSTQTKTQISSLKEETFSLN